MKIEFIEWIYQANSRSLWQEQPLTDAEQQRRERIINAVQEALEELDPTERLIVEKHHFQGETLVDIARQLDRKAGAVVNSHRRALRTLRKHLSRFAATEFGINGEAPKCPICNCPEREAVDALIAAKRPEEPYGLLMRQLRKQFGLEIRSPQTIIGHQKYHS